MPKIFYTLVTACLAVLLTERCFSESVFVELSDVPVDGFIVCPLDMTPAVNWFGNGRFGPIEFYYGDRKIDATSVPSSGDTPWRGSFVAVLPDDIPRGKPCRLRIENKFDDGNPWLGPYIPPFTATSASSKIVFDGYKHGGLPSSIAFADGKTLETMKWHDRLHDPDTGSCDISNNKNALIAMVGDIPFLKVIRTTVPYRKSDGSRPPSQPKVMYDWFIFPQRELVYVIAAMQQDEPVTWKE
ncbi:MAG: hypothetical protein FWD31_10505, partial [Planctomycetaceae bacterium]|nr:hypothetical protein [Planctomycetaceae bacterium]